MKSALSDFILGKKGIYGILHIIILLMSLFLVISISIDTFKGIPFYTQSSYMKNPVVDLHLVPVRFCTGVFSGKA